MDPLTRVVGRGRGDRGDRGGGRGAQHDVRCFILHDNEVSLGDESRFRLTNIDTISMLSCIHPGPRAVRQSHVGSSREIRPPSSSGVHLLVSVELVFRLCVSIWLMDDKGENDRHPPPPSSSSYEGRNRWRPAEGWMVSECGTGSRVVAVVRKGSSSTRESMHCISLCPTRSTPRGTRMEHGETRNGCHNTFE